MSKTPIVNKSELRDFRNRAMQTLKNDDAIIAGLHDSLAAWLKLWDHIAHALGGDDWLPTVENFDALLDNAIRAHIQAAQTK